MNVDLDKYTPIDLNFIKNNIEIIKFNSPEIICTSNDNLYMQIPNYKIDILLDREFINSDIFNNFYINKNSKSIIDLILEQNDKTLLFSETMIPDIFFSDYLSQIPGDYLKIYLWFQ